MQGTVKQILSFPEMEGDPLLMDLRSSWLCIATSNGFLRIYDLSRREAKQQYQSKYVVESIDNFNRFVMVKMNKDGNRVSFTCTTDDSKEVSSYLTVWDAESDTIAYFDFTTGMTDQQQYEAETDAALAAGQRPTTAAVRKIEREQIRYRMLEHSPGVHCWDSEDSRFLICEANHRNP
uniref:WD_REPEATS_REGION domain-containing protein n=1 Tax=Ascaris lumbricoides TaxID=6252 RepID=A0A0M3IWZ2_ASCLU